MDFLGSKRALTAFLVEAFESSAGRGSHVADLFCGTAAISGVLRARGWQVTANDHLRLCSTFAEAALLTDAMPTFAGLGGPTYEMVLAELNAVPADRGFIHAHYSPAGGRMYLTESNAARVDAVRERIRQWEPALTRGERARLLADLAIAVSRVSNTAGTYGCYLKKWKARALEPLQLTPAATPPPGTARHSVHCDDAEALAPRLESAIVYADPPYTKRQYAAYYHLLETIVVGDRPELVGSTGLRPWQDKQSDWCYRRRAPGALERLIQAVRCEHFFLSYSEDGQIPDAVIREILSQHGRVHVREIAYRRYRSSRRPHKGPEVRERLYHLAFA
jgi:adenine-specific DNA-methyltransferase